MDTLGGTSWDVVIAGTGLQPALLALTLSRSDKKVLHLDQNSYYGGAEAALSLDEAEDWTKRITNDTSRTTRFARASVRKWQSDTDGTDRLSSSRSYNLSLSPRLIYTRSALLQALVSSKAHEQLEFLAVGSWFVWHVGEGGGSLFRVPNSREDIFNDAALTLRAKSALVKFLRFVATYQDDDKRDIWLDHKDLPFGDFLQTKFKIPVDFHGPLLALSMSTKPSSQTITADALAAIQRHLTSMGVFGAGFSAVLPKYGGLSEIVQVACRAAAVGGTVYVLNRSIDALQSHSSTESSGDVLEIRLQGGDTITTSKLIGVREQLPPTARAMTETIVSSHMIAIVHSRLPALFPVLGESGPPPAAAVVVFPSAAAPAELASHSPAPVHAFVHSGASGECPVHQCVVYLSTLQPLDPSHGILENALQQLIKGAQDPLPAVLWSMSYEAHSPSPLSGPALSAHADICGLYEFIDAPYGSVFDDGILESVRQAWTLVADVGDASGQAFLRFADRNADVEPDD